MGLDFKKFIPVGHSCMELQNRNSKRQNSNSKQQQNRIWVNNVLSRLWKIILAAAQVLQQLREITYPCLRLPMAHPTTGTCKTSWRRRANRGQPTFYLSALMSDCNTCNSYTAYTVSSTYTALRLWIRLKIGTSPVLSPRRHVVVCS